MRRTGGVLEIGLHDETLPVEHHTSGGLLPAGCYVCLTVRDTGEGLPRDMTSPIFAPSFKTLPSPEARPGLSVAHEIVMAHGGTLLVDSGPGLGTTVSVYLPALSPPVSPSSRQDEPLPHGRECILFVDDDEALARFGGEMLESLGYYPVVRLNAAEAWKAFQIAPQRFDLLITDRAMPGMTGEMLARECQRLRPDLPVILCTGSDPMVSTDHATSNGITEYVLKPLTLQDLAHTIRRVLDTRAVAPPSEDTRSTSTWLIEERDALSTRR
jgi:CheY-like chemotaxis protein